MDETRWYEAPIIIGLAIIFVIMWYFFLMFVIEVYRPNQVVMSILAHSD